MKTNDANRKYLSTKPISPRERLIFALDVASADDARAMVEKLGDSVLFYKIGLQLFMAGGYFELLEWLLPRFPDVTFHWIIGSDILADLPELTRGTHAGRASPTDITLFKSVGHALEDLAAAQLVMAPEPGMIRA